MDKPINQRVYSGTIWEKKVAYCRARRVRDHVWVAGTTAVDDQGGIVCPSDIVGQTRFVFQKIERALKECGASMHDVVRTRMFLTRMQDFEGMASVHREVFEGIDPAATCVGVSTLVDPALMIEIEVDAIVQ